MEDWAEIRRLHRSEGLSKAAIARRLGIARNTVARALASDRPPTYQRISAGSAVDGFEPQIRALLAEFPAMAATVIAERIGWTRSLTVLRDRVRELRPLFMAPDPADRIEYAAGELAQCDLWFPPVAIPVGRGVERILPVLAMTCGYSRITDAVMIPSRKAGDILAGMWEIIGSWGRCPHNLVWDREAAIGGTGKLTAEAAAFAGTLGVRIKLLPARDPESKGLVERRNGYFETSFLPGRSFTSPFDFNAQIETWLHETANRRYLRSIGTSPDQRWDTDRAAMVELSPVAPTVGLTGRVRLPLLWALGWTVTTLAMVAVDEQFTVFGAAGAVTFSALSGLLLHRILPHRVDASADRAPTASAATPRPPRGTSSSGPAAHGAAVVTRRLNSPYPQWTAQFPAL